MVDITTDSNDKVKVVLVGDMSVGKSSIALRYTRGKFSDALPETVSVAFFSQSVETSGGTIKFQIWDTAGQERYRCLLPMYFRGAEAAIIVYDVTNKQTFSNVPYWQQLLLDSTTNSLQFVLVGNKTDLKDKREVCRELAEKFAAEQHMQFYEASARTGESIEDIFCGLAKSLVNDGQRKQSVERSSILLDSLSFKSDKKTTCCGKSATPQ